MSTPHDDPWNLESKAACRVTCAILWWFDLFSGDRAAAAALQALTEARVTIHDSRFTIHDSRFSMSSFPILDFRCLIPDS